MNIFLRNEAIMRRNRRSKVKRKERNIQRNKHNPYKVRTPKQSFNRQRQQEITIDAGRNFALFTHPDEVIDLIHELDKYKTKPAFLKRIFIDLSNIKSIDIGAINVLLAKINEISKLKRLHISGNMPIHSECHNLFEESGFLEYMVDLSGKKFAKKSDSFILSIGSDKTLNEKIGRSIEKSMGYLTGEEKSYPPVYSIVQEMCSNSIEWANQSDSKSKNWLLGIQFDKKDDEPIVNFALTDIGFGIIKTINRKLGTKFKESIGNISDLEILIRTFDKIYGSKSKEPNRNNGMPLIKKRFEKGYISELRVVTNKVFYDFSNNEQSKVLNRNFPGTYYSWSINSKCIEKWDQK